MRRQQTFWLIVFLFAAWPTPAVLESTTHAAPLPAVGSSIGKAVLKYFGKEGGEEASSYLAKKGGQEIVERVAGAAAKEGGPDAVQQIAKLTSKYGPEALAALDNSPSLLPLIKALDEIPESQVKAALAKLAAGAPGRELAETVARYGAVALRSELKHPGVGMILVRSLGDEGADLAARLSGEQAIAVARHADDLAKLPATQRGGIVTMIRNETDRMVAFIGRFVEANPGKSLFTVATTTVILAQPERILGGDEVVFDAQGNPIVVAKSGLVGRGLDAGGEAAAHVSDRYLRPLMITAMAFAGTFVALWMMIKLWHIHRDQRASSVVPRGEEDVADKASSATK